MGDHDTRPQAQFDRQSGSAFRTQELSDLPVDGENNVQARGWTGQAPAH